MSLQPIWNQTSGTTFITANAGRIVASFPFDLTICEFNIVADKLYTIQPSAQIYSYVVASNPILSHTPEILPIDRHLEQSILDIFDAYQHEEFDADIAYYFTNALDALILANGNPAIQAINLVIKKYDLKYDMIFEILRALGRIEDETTKDERYKLLIRFITHKSPIVRDGAISALSFLDDKRALPQLRMLLEAETSQTLKNNIKVAIKSLEY